MDNWIIRKIQKEDNQAVAQLIRDVFDELNIPKVGTAYEDPYLDLMFEEYNKPRSVYYVVESEDELLAEQEWHHWQTKRTFIVNCKKCIFSQKPAERELEAK